MRALIAIIACLGMPACGPSATEGGFDSANSAAKMYAIEDAARSGDQSAVKNLIEQLNSDDPGVRFLAIASLERLTGETHDYRHYDSAADRQDAVARWVSAYEADQIQPMISAPNAASSSAPAGNPNG